MNVPNYEASYTDETDPGFHLITRVATSPERLEMDVIKVTELTVVEGKLLCRFEMLVDDINEQTAEILIKSVLLNQFCDRFFEDKVSGLDLFDLSTGKQKTVPYGQ